MGKINFYLKPGTENKAGQKSIVMRITYDGKIIGGFDNFGQKTDVLISNVSSHVEYIEGIKARDSSPGP